MSLEKIKRRKDELQAEIDRIERNYISQASEIEGKVKKFLRPVNKIRTKPFKALGISVAVGFVIGYMRKKKSRSPYTSESSGSRSDTGFTTLFIAELKRIAAQRAMIYVSELVDKKVMPKFAHNKEGSTKGEVSYSKDTAKEKREKNQKVANIH